MLETKTNVLLGNSVNIWISKSYRWYSQFDSEVNNCTLFLLTRKKILCFLLSRSLDENVDMNHAARLRRLILHSFSLFQLTQWDKLHVSIVKLLRFGFAKKTPNTTDVNKSRCSTEVPWWIFLSHQSNVTRLVSMLFCLRRVTVP